MKSCGCWFFVKSQPLRAERGLTHINPLIVQVNWPAVVNYLVQYDREELGVLMHAHMHRQIFSLSLLHRLLLS